MSLIPLSALVRYDSGAMRMDKPSAAFAGIALLAMATAVDASTVIVDFTASVTTVTDPTSVTDGSIAVGTEMTGHMSYDDSATPTGGFVIPGVETRSDYSIAAPPASLTASAGHYSFAVVPTLKISIFDLVPGAPHNGDTFESDVSSGVATGPIQGDPSVFFQLFLVDSTDNALHSSSLADVPFELSLYDTAEFNLSFPNSGGVSTPQTRIEATIDSLHATVPEPESIALLGVVGLALCFSARVRRSGSSASTTPTRLVANLGHS